MATHSLILSLGVGRVVGQQVLLEGGGLGERDAGGAEAPSAADGLGELGGLLESGGGHELDDELAHAVAVLHVEVLGAEVLKERVDLAAVVGIDHAREHVDAVLGGQA